MYMFRMQWLLWMVKVQGVTSLEIYCLTSIAKPHCRDEILQPNQNQPHRVPFTGKMACLYWNGLLSACVVLVTRIIVWLVHAIFWNIRSAFLYHMLQLVVILCMDLTSCVCEWLEIKLDNTKIVFVFDSYRTVTVHDLASVDGIMLGL